MIDLHCHTEVSFDSNAKLENYYTKHKVKYFCQTEHYEYEPLDFKFDFTKIKSEIKGIEIGYSEKYIKEINKIVNSNFFDIVLLSLHNITGRFVNDMEEQLDVKLYFEKLYSMLTKNIEFDVLAHIDYPFRYKKISISDIANNCELLIECLKQIIRNNYYLELNTTSIYKYETSELTFYIFEIYYELGGRKISLGSDCHKVEDYMFKFDELQRKLSKYKNLEILNHKIENKLDSNK